MSLSKKRKYEAVLLYLNAHHLELYDKIDNLLGDSSATLEDIRAALEDYALLESSFTALKKRWGPVINPAPNVPAPDETSPAITITEADLLKRSPTYRKSMDDKKTDGEK